MRFDAYENMALHDLLGDKRLAAQSWCCQLAKIITQLCDGKPIDLQFTTEDQSALTVEILSEITQDCIELQVRQALSMISDPRARVTESYKLILGRDASAEEISHHLSVNSIIPDDFLKSDEFRNRLCRYCDWMFIPYIPSSMNLHELIKRGIFTLIYSLERCEYFPDPLKRQWKRLASICKQHQLCQPAIYVDLTLISESNSRTGIQRVTHEIFHRLVMNYRTSRLVVPVIARNGLLFEDYSYIAKCFRLPIPARSDLCVSPQPNDILFGLDFNPTLYECREFIESNFSPENVFYFAHDIIPIKQPSFWEDSKNAFYNHAKWLDFSLETGSIICNSFSTLSDIKQWINNTGIKRSFVSNDSVVHLGFDFSKSDFYSNQTQSQGCQKTEDQLKENQKFTALAVGTIEPRKGYIELIEEISNHNELNPESTVKLIIVGKSGWNNSSILDKISQSSDTTWMGQVDDRLLANLYQKCDLIICFSLDEGFGLSVVEAMKYGKPILARDIPAFREIKELTQYEGLTLATRQGFGDAIHATLTQVGRLFSLTKTRSWDDTFLSLLDVLLP
jgi:glycosyltransferase involved in cell wall biosynthesis